MTCPGAPQFTAAVAVRCTRGPCSCEKGLFMQVRRFGLLGALALLLVSPCVVKAEEPASAAAVVEKEQQAGHSHHGEAFNEGPRQKAYLMGTTGNVSLKVTTKSPEAQEFFNQGLGQLHGFWYFEAERSFRQVAGSTPIAPWPIGAWRWQMWRTRSVAGALSKKPSNARRRPVRENNSGSTVWRRFTRPAKTRRTATMNGVAENTSRLGKDHP